ncbi:MAG: helix-turn-helix transcriptional regulator [Clostridia bacterium]|nr:helix-turn-helix transcriptional regulator [Clostridia bacterium]
MDFSILEARRFTSPYYKSSKREVKDYEIDLEYGNERTYNCSALKSRTLYRGDVLVRAPHDTVFSVGAQDSFILTLDFSNRAIPEIYSRNVLGDFQPPCTDDLILSLAPIIHPRDTAAISYIYKRLIALPDRNSPPAKELVKELLYTLGAEIAHGNYEASVIDDDKSDVIISYMLKNLDSRITLDTLCSLVHLEKSYLVRTFKSKTGKTPIEMLISFRMDKACDLVLSTDMKISDISELCGYRVQSFFIAEYKKHFSVTPSEHRKLVSKS